MTLVGKIFTVLIFVMSLVFMSFAVMVFATHTNWKEVALNTTPTANKPLGLKKQLEDVYTAKRALEVELERFKTQLAEHQAARRAALATLQVKMEALAADLTSAQDELAKLTSAHTEAVQKLGVAEANMEKAINEVGQLRTDIVAITQDRDEKLQRAVALTDTVNQATLKLNQLEERKMQLLDQVAQQKKVMDTYGLTVTTPIESIPPKVDGMITAVSENDRVEISLGSDDGLRVGHKLEVFRGSEYLGKIVLSKVSANRAVGEVVKEFKKGPIRKGDKVATRIS